MSGETIWFLAPFRLPSEHAHSIQILNTCLALAAEGARIRLFVKRDPARPGLSVEESLATYGLKPHEGLRIEWLPTTHNPLQGVILRWKIFRSKERPVFYVRHLRLASTAKGRGLVLTELHKIEDDTRKAVLASDGVVTITSALRDTVKAKFDVRVPVEVIPDAVDLARFPPVTGRHPPRLVYTGQFQDWKGVDVLVRSLKLLPSLPALMIGGREGEDPLRNQLMALAAQEGVADRIEWTGYLPQAEIPRRLRGGDIGVVSTRAFNGQDLAASPLKLFEYMSAGLPIVASDLPSLRDVIRPGENGMLFKEGDPASLAAAVRRLTEEPARGEALAARAREEAIARYSWQARATHILQFIRSFARST
jgi:glycosyltransferase involved in cell wall biosynthesis